MLNSFIYLYNNIFKRKLTQQIKIIKKILLYNYKIETVAEVII